MQQILSAFASGLIYRTNDGWTAAFYMEPDDSSNDEAAELLRQRGYAPVYHFDFSDYGFLTSRWDGKSWTLLDDGEGNGDPDSPLSVSPGQILGRVGIRAPYDDPDLSPKRPHAEPLRPREAIVIEGASLEETRQVAGGSLQVELGPRGPIVYQPDLSTRFAFWERAPGRVLEVKFYPQSGEFGFRVMQGEDCLGTFRPGETRTWDGTPYLPDVDGATDPGAIVEKLGIPRSFVQREPS